MASKAAAKAAASFSTAASKPKFRYLSAWVRNLRSLPVPRWYFRLQHNVIQR